MKMFFFSIMTLLAAVFGIIQNASASCDVGPVLFRDTLYGAAVGTGVGALVLLSTSSSSNIPSTLATSALVGAGVGLVVGVVEISMSNCTTGGGGRKSHDDSQNYGLNLKPMVTIVEAKSGNLLVPSIQPSRNDFSINTVAGGITLEYALN